jgi:hypothetical protein
MLEERQFQLLLFISVIGTEHSLLPLTVGKSHVYGALDPDPHVEDGWRARHLNYTPHPVPAQISGDADFTSPVVASTIA